MKELIRPSKYLDTNNWDKTFPKFIEMIGKADDQESKHKVITFSDQRSFIFSKESMIQIFTLLNIIDDQGYYNAVCLKHSHLTKEVYNRSRETILKTRDKLIKLKEDFFPDGWEPLNHIKYKGWTTYSIETFDGNRLIYVPKIELNKIYVVSLFGHYKDKPRLSSDKLVMNMIYNEEDRDYTDLEQYLELFKRRYLK